MSHKFKFTTNYYWIGGLGGLFGLYLLTLARGLVMGDPTEYTLVANVLGIAHPPGYAFITLLGKLFQSLIPIGDIPWRMHLLSAVMATLAGGLAYAIVQLVGQQSPFRHFVGLFTALTIGTATDFWQHGIHANPHIITATFLAANLFLLTKWANSGADKWLYGFCFSAGLGLTHHPLTVMSFPAYGVFVLLTRPGLLGDWRALLKMVAFALAGLSLWLYYPIRSSLEPIYGPHDMNTLNGFLNVVLARGLTEALPRFTLADQPGRVLVFFTLLRLQYSLPVILLAFCGLRRGRLLWLYGLAFLGNYAFVMSLRAQDIMAYLLGPFWLVGLLAGLGLLWLLDSLARRLQQAPAPLPGRDNGLLALLVGAIFLLGPGLQLARNLPRISLAGYQAGDAYVAAVFDWFTGRNESAVLLNDWEHTTPLWYEKFVSGRWPAENEVRPLLVSTSRPWVESVFDYLGGGPVYLSNYRREIVDVGFRLRPRGPFYQVVEPGDRTIPAELTAITAPAGDAPIQLLAYQRPAGSVTAGDYLPLTLAMSLPVSTTTYFVPTVRVGDLQFTFTTDSHLVTPQWQANEVIVERFDLALPHQLAGGSYPLTVQFKDLLADEWVGPVYDLGQLTVLAHPLPVATDNLLANYRQRVGLAGASGRSGLQFRTAPWSEPMLLRPGQTINLTLHWLCLDYAEESYTIFIHLIDGANQPLVALDYTPLGGSAPTYLWIPKWLPGQQFADPYRLTIPPTLPPGDYAIEVGLYEMVSQRRLHISDPAGNLTGDRYILGGIRLPEQP